MSSQGKRGNGGDLPPTPGSSYANHLKKIIEDQKKKISSLEARAVAEAHEDGSDEEPMEEDDIPEAIWDTAECISRCTECHFEVVEGTCQNMRCQTIHIEDPDEAWSGEMGAVYSSVATADEHVRDDRYPTHRGSTPLNILDVSELSEFVVPPGYSLEEYAVLRKRGATRSMILTFDLEFSEEKGIYAWADQGLFNAFSGPAMQEGDRWCIQLGRRIQLDPQDIDGSIFIDDLLEEIAHAPEREWETRLDTVSSQRTWYTRTWRSRPAGDGVEDKADNIWDVDPSTSGSEDESDAEKKSGPAIPPPVLVFHNDYEDDLEGDSEADEEMEVESDHSWNPDSSSDEEPANKGPQEEVAIPPEGPPAGDDATLDPDEDMDSDIPGSDWDSEEELSGDEAPKLVTRPDGSLHHQIGPL